MPTPGGQGKARVALGLAEDPLPAERCRRRRFRRGLGGVTICAAEARALRVAAESKNCRNHLAASIILLGGS